MFTRLSEFPRREARRLRAWWRASRWNQALLLAVVVYGVAFSILTCLRVLALSAFAWDLGLFNQAMYTTVAQGRFFEVSTLPGIPPRSLFAGHFSPILFLFVVPYWLAPSPFTLVVLQTWGVALAAVPIYLLGQTLLHSDRFAFAFAITFLLNPATQGVNWFDFHTEAFIPLALSLALYFYETRRWRGFLLAVVFALSTIEMASILVIMVAFGGLLSEFWSVRVDRGLPDRERVLALAVALAISAVWLVLATAVAHALSPEGAFFQGLPGAWVVLGASSLYQVPLAALLHLGNALAALSFDAPAKAWYLIVLFAPLQVATFRSPRSLLGCLPWLGVSLLSNYPSYYLVGNQYPAFVLPFLYYGAMVGLARPWHLPAGFRRILPWRLMRGGGVTMREHARTMVSVGVILLLVVSPLGPWALGADTTGRFPVLTAHDRMVLGLYGMIPETASVLTQNDLFPLVSGRSNVHFIPVNVIFPPGTSFNMTMDTWVSTMDYILADPTTSFIEAALLLSWRGVSSNFSVVAAADGAVLLERGQHALESFQPVTLLEGPQTVVPQNATLVRDSFALSGFALLHENLTTSHFWYGPFLILPAGSYTVSYRLKADRPSVGPLLALPVILHPVVIRAQVVLFNTGAQQAYFVMNETQGQVLLNTHEIYGEGVPSPGAYFWVDTTFDVHTLGVFEFPGLGASGSVRMYFDELTIVENQPSLNATASVVWS